MSHGARERADRASPAREWPSHRRQARDARRRGVARARSLSGLARQGRTDGLHRRDARSLPASSSPRTTPAACSCSRRRAPAASCSSRGRPGSSTVSSSARWASDPGLEIDSVVRKGKNEQGAETFYVQAAQSRSDSLATGYPSTREALFRYDALVLANVEAASVHARGARGDARASSAIAGAVCWCSGRGRSSARDSPDRCSRTLLPLELNAERGTVERTSGVPSAGRRAGVNRVALTPAGEAASRSCSSRREPTIRGSDGKPCRRLPRSRRSAGRGPGASVLAVTERPRRHAPRARGGATLRRGPVDDLRRRSVLALAHAAARGRSLVRHVLEAIACAGWRSGG